MKLVKKNATLIRAAFIAGMSLTPEQIADAYLKEFGETEKADKDKRREAIKFVRATVKIDTKSLDKALANTYVQINY